jgi:hypothetical protein
MEETAMDEHPDGLVLRGVVQKATKLNTPRPTDELLICVIGTASSIKTHAPAGAYAEGDPVRIEITNCDADVG